MEKLNTEEAIFEALLMIDEKITKLTDRFEALFIKELGYKL